MPATPIEDWTRGPAKWAAVIVLALAGAGALAWSFASASSRPARLVRAEEAASPGIASTVRTDERGSDGDDPAEGGAAIAERSLADDGDPARRDEAWLGPPTPGGQGTAATGVVAEVASPDGGAPPTPATADPASRKINLNSASPAELELLPGIGPALAKRIVSDRERLGKFRGIDDLDRVPGIGPRTIEKLRPMVIAE